MGIAAGPNVSRDGLVLYYDIANIKSFRGEPTTNLVASPKSVTTGYASTIPTRTDNQLINFDGTVTAGLLSGTGWIAYTSASTTNGNRYTTSWYVKAGTITSVTFTWGGAHQGNVTNFTFNLSTGAVSSLTLASGENYGVDSFGNGWWRVWYSSTLSTGNAYYPQLSIGNGTIYLGGLQIEQKSYSTPFVVGTRGTTVATGGGVIDLTSLGNSGELVNGPTYSSSYGGFISFDGTNDYVKFPSIPLSAITVSVWVRSSSWSTQTHPMIFAKGINVEWILWKSDDGGNDEKFGWRGSATIYSTTTAQNNIWYHLVASIGSSGMKLYVNGVLEASNGTTTFSSGSNEIALATGITNGTPGNYLLGDISIAKIWNRQLTDAQVKDIYNATRVRFQDRQTIVTNGLVLNLDASNRDSYIGTGNTWFDLSGFGNNMALNNGPSFKTNNGGGIRLIGSNSNYINLSGTKGFDSSGTFTYEVWLRFDSGDSIGNGAHIIGANNRSDGLLRGSSGNNSNLTIDGSGNLRVFTFNGGGSSNDYDTGFDVAVGEICQVGFIHNSGTNKAGFKNGAISSFASYWSTQNFTYLLIGGEHNEASYFTQMNYPNITIFSVKIYNRALSATEILQNYNAQKSRFGL